METCQICSKKFKSFHSLSIHICQLHKICSKEYYDKYLLEGNNNLCVICNETTSYRGLGTGYLKHCSPQCRDKNKDIEHKYWLGKKQPKELIEKRIKNTDQIIKELKKRNTLISRYGYDNPSKIPSAKLKLSLLSKNSKKPRSKEWQQKIVNSKRINGTLKHSLDTINKIKQKLNDYHSSNLDKSKFLSENCNKQCVSGWFRNVFFRSSLELSFLYHFRDKEIRSCENNHYSIKYENNGRIKTYFPDFTDGESVYEVKPLRLKSLDINILKFNVAKEKYGDRFKVITEIDCPYLSKEIIINLIIKKDVLLTKNGQNALLKYRF